MTLARGSLREEGENAGVTWRAASFGTLVPEVVWVAGTGLRTSLYSPCLLSCEHIETLVVWVLTVQSEAMG